MKIVLPPSKSRYHRALILASLSGVSLPDSKNGNDCDDIMATRRCLKAIFSGENDIVADCGESGTTLRLLLPIAGAVLAPGQKAMFCGHGRLAERPLEELLLTLQKNGAAIVGEKLPVTIGDGLKPGNFELPGNVTSQYVSGLLFALPLLPGESRIRLTTPLESQEYVKMTLEMLAEWGICWQKVDASKEFYEEWYIRGPVRTQFPKSGVSVDDMERDWYNGIVWLCAGRLNQRIPLDLDYPPTELLDLLDEISLGGGQFDMRDRLDLVPVLAVYASSFLGKMTTFTGCGRLRLKESDRLTGISNLLSNLGGRAKVVEDALVVEGVGKLVGGHCSVLHDHRLAMAAYLAELLADSPIVVDDHDCIKKSWPDFLELWRKYRQS